MLVVLGSTHYQKVSVQVTAVAIYIFLETIYQVIRYQRTSPHTEEPETTSVDVKDISEKGVTLTDGRFILWNDVKEVIKEHRFIENLWTLGWFAVIGHDLTAYLLKIQSGDYLRLKNIASWKTYSIPRPKNAADKTYSKCAEALLRAAKNHPHISFSYHDKLNDRKGPFNPGQEIEDLIYQQGDKATARKLVRQKAHKDKQISILIKMIIALVFLFLLFLVISTVRQKQLEQRTNLIGISNS